MHTNVFTQILRVRFAAMAFASLLATGCGIDKTVAPGLTGPSEFAQSISLTATPDFLVQDGVSQTRIEAIARDAQSKPISGLAIRWSADRGSIAGANPLSITDANGRASITVTAPPPPATLPTGVVTMNVTATPGGTDVNNAVTRAVAIRLLTPEGTLGANNNPVASFTIVPAVGTLNEAVQFDASATTDEGLACGAKCIYRWDFGDLNHDTGMIVFHKYAVPGVYSVTLTVTDDRGGVASTSRALTVNGPAAPVAQFAVTPTSPAANAAITFNGSASSVGTGATITKYFWEFDDGTTADSGTVPVYVKTSGFGSGTHVVTLTITDSFGRQAAKTTTVTVP